MRRLREALRRDDSGLSMTEVLVSMLLTSILLAAAGGMLVQVSKITTSSNQTQNSTKTAANIANGVTSVLRVSTKIAKAGDVMAPAIVAGTRSSISVYANSNTDPANVGPTRVAFTLDAAGNVVEDRCVAKPSGTYWTFTSCASTSTRTIGQGVIAPGVVVKGKTAGQLFTYLDGNGNPIVLSSPTAGLTDDQRKSVASIVVEVWVQAPGSKTAASVIKNTVVLRNLGLGS